MLKLEDNFVEGSFIIPAHISYRTSEMITRSKVECAQENLDVADNTPKTMRKRRASNENKSCAALGAMDVNAPSKKNG